MIALHELREKVCRKTGFLYSDKELLAAWTKAEEEDRDRSEGRVPLEMLRAADVITGGPRVKNCENCDHEGGGECHFHGELGGKYVDLRGLRVNDSICCGAWESPDMVRLADLVGEKWFPKSVCKRAGPFTSATVLAMLPPNQANLVQVMAGYVADDDLAPEGREDEPHISLLYGLPDSAATEVANVVRGFGQVRAVLGVTSLFKGADGDVLKLDVTSDGLHRLNAKLGKLPHSDTFLSYRPHVTLAYLKPGRGEKYVGMTEARGQSVTIDKVQFSDTQGRKVVIPLGASSQLNTVRSGGTCKPGERADLTGCVPAAHIGKWVRKDKGQPCVQGETAASDGCVPASGGGSEAHELADKVWSQGGFTYGPVGHDSPTEGVVVSLPREAGWEEPMTEDEFRKNGEAHLLAYLTKVRDAIKAGKLDKGLAHVGGWRDTATGRVVLDVNEVYHDERQAAEVGRRRQQDGIYNLGTGQVIDLRDATGARPTGDVGKAHRGRDGRGVGGDRRTHAPGVTGRRVFSGGGGAVGKSLPRNFLKGRGQPCEQGETAASSGCVPASGGGSGRNVPQRPRGGKPGRGVAPRQPEDTGGLETSEGPDELDFTSVSPSPFLETAYGGKRSEFGAASARAVGGVVRSLSNLAAKASVAKESVGFMGAVAMDMLSDPVRRNLVQVGGLVELVKGHVEEWSDKVADIAAEVAAKHAPGPQTEQAWADALNVANLASTVGIGGTLLHMAEKGGVPHEVAHLGSELIQVVPVATLGYLAFAAVRNPSEVFHAAGSVLKGWEARLEEVVDENLPLPDFADERDTAL